MLFFFCTFLGQRINKIQTVVEIKTFLTWTLPHSCLFLCVGPRSHPPPQFPHRPNKLHGFERSCLSLPQTQTINYGTECKKDVRILATSKTAEWISSDICKWPQFSFFFLWIFWMLMSNSWMYHKNRIASWQNGSGTIFFQWLLQQQNKILSIILIGWLVSSLVFKCRNPALFWLAKEHVSHNDTPKSNTTVHAVWRHQCGSPKRLFRSKFTGMCAPPSWTLVQLRNPVTCFSSLTRKFNLSQCSNRDDWSTDCSGSVPVWI